MSMEEQDLLRSAVKEFSQKAIQDKVLKIEHDGIDDDLLRSLSAQGFLAARFPEKHGGSGIGQDGYLAILEELAAASPSVAALIMVNNSLLAPLIGEKDPELMSRIASGEAKVSISLAPVLPGNVEKITLEKVGNSLKGTVRNAVLSDGGLLIALSGPDDTLYLIKDGLKPGETDQYLSFRGLKFGSVSVDSKDFVPLFTDGKKALEKVLDGADLEIAALALGIAKGALDKAVEYVKVRKTFERPLKDYGPVSSTLSRLIGEYEVLNSYLGNIESGSEKDKLMVKTLSVDLAKRATKYSLQFHGGYGYIEDFGVEKFYRDAVGLSILFQRPHQDSQRLAEEIFGEKSGYL